jgi:hypothetical protein
MPKKITAMRIVGVLVLLVALPLSSQAGTSTGVFSSIVISNLTNAVSFVAGAHNNKPTCANGSNDYWSFSLSNANAKAMYALLLSAAAQGRTIVVVGFACDAGSTSETPAAITVNFQKGELSAVAEMKSVLAWFIPHRRHHVRSRGSRRGDVLCATRCFAWYADNLTGMPPHGVNGLSLRVAAKRRRADWG